MQKSQRNTLRTPAWIVTKRAKQLLRICRQADILYVWKSTRTMSGLVIDAALPLSRGFRCNGLFAWRHLQSRLSKQCVPAKSGLYRNDLKRTIFIGWKISATGASPDSFGGDTESRHFSVTAAGKWWLPKKNKSTAQNAGPRCSKTRTRWIPGFPLHCGLSPRSAGPTKQKICVAFIQQMHLLQGMTSLPSGSPA